jgi:isoleucyl-tRNA synthetase
MANAQAGEALDDTVWADLLAVRAEVNKALEVARNEKLIGSSLQAEVTLFANAELAAKLHLLGDELRFVLLTSKALVQEVSAQPEGAQATEVAGLWLQVAVSTAAKCERCWHHVDDVGAHEGHGDICGRCVTNVAGEGEIRRFA